MYYCMFVCVYIMSFKNEIQYVFEKVQVQKLPKPIKII